MSDNPEELIRDLPTQASGRNWTWTRWVQTGTQRWQKLEQAFWRVPADVRERRYQACRACEHFRPRSTTCRKCGCVMVVKTWLGGYACPVGKWHAEEPPQSNGDSIRNRDS